MPQGSSTSPGWFVKVINEVTKGLEQIAAYLDDVIVFNSDPSAHVKTIRALFEQLRKHNLKLSPPKARLGATDADFLSHSISPTGVRQKAEKVSALSLHANVPRPETAALSPGWPFVLPKVSARYVQTDSTNHGLPQEGRQLFCSRRAWKTSCVTCSRSLPFHRPWSSPIGTPWRTAPALFGCTATPALTALALR